MTTPQKAKVASALRQWREAKGWTRREAAEHLGVNERTLEGWEYGTRTPPALTVLERMLVKRSRPRR